MVSDLSFSVEQKDLRLVAKAIRREADSKQLRKDLIAELKRAVEPLRDEVRSSILSMSTHGLGHEGESLRQAIANKVIVQVRTGGRATGVALKAKQLRTRGFIHAPKRLNRQKGWRHPVFHRVTKNGVEVNVWVTQFGKTRWFDDPIRQHRSQYRREVTKVLEQTARRIAARRS